MDTKLPQVAKAMIDSLMDAEKMGDYVDGSDQEATEETPGVMQFTMTKYHDVVIPGHRGPGGRIPKGRIVYIVKVEAKYESFDEE